MSQHPFLKSIRPVNLLSFGPNTEELELKALNILIGPNGSGKSNLIEIIGLLSKLPDKDPWADVIQTGGAREWIWKRQADHAEPSIAVYAEIDDIPTNGNGLQSLYDAESAPTTYFSISLQESGGSFGVVAERFVELEQGEDGTTANRNAFDRSSWEVETHRLFPAGVVHLRSIVSGEQTRQPLNYGRSVLSQLGKVADIAATWPRMHQLASKFERITCYRDWTFGKESKSRQLQPVGLSSYQLAPDSSNVAQVLKAMRDRGNSATFDRLLENMKSFYAPIKDVDTELVGTHLRIMIKEEGLNSRTPAERLSDGTLRWLMLLIALLNPAPPPVKCIDKPELGLHPDMIPTLADLLRDASTRTQLVLTTHSRSLVECFSDEPESICVCEKFDGATEIKRLEADRMKVWLEKYSLGQLWSSGEIGGNRW